MKQRPRGGGGGGHNYYNHTHYKHNSMMRMATTTTTTTKGATTTTTTTTTTTSIYWLIVCFLLVVGNVTAAVDERDILIKLYQSTGGTNWNNNTNWATTKSYCTWNGIICGSSDGKNDDGGNAYRCGYRRGR